MFTKQGFLPKMQFISIIYFICGSGVPIAFDLQRTDLANSVSQCSACAGLTFPLISCPIPPGPYSCGSEALYQLVLLVTRASPRRY